MLEIILIIYLCKKMGDLLRKKGWKPLFMQVLVVVGWISAEFFGAIAYFVYVAVTQGQAAAEAIGFAAYPWALLAGAFGQLCLFGFAWALPVNSPVGPVGDISQSTTSTSSGDTNAPYTPIG